MNRLSQVELTAAPMQKLIDEHSRISKAITAIEDAYLKAAQLEAQRELEYQNILRQFIRQKGFYGGSQ